MLVIVLSDFFICSRLVAVPAADKQLHVLDTRQSLLPVMSLVGHNAPVLCAATDQAATVVSGAADGNLLAHDLKTGTTSILAVGLLLCFCCLRICVIFGCGL